MSKKTKSTVKKTTKKSKKILTAIFSLLGIGVVGVGGYFGYEAYVESTIPTTINGSVDLTANFTKWKETKKGKEQITKYNKDLSKTYGSENLETYLKNYYIRTRVSDHTLVGSTFTYNNIEYNVGHWNTLNFSLGKITSVEEKAYNIASVMIGYNYDLLGMTEINANVVKENDDSAIEDFLDIVNRSIPEDKKDSYYYDAIVSKNTPVTAQTAQNPNFKDGQTEQVAIIYNTKKFQPTSFSSLNITQNDAYVGYGLFYSNPIGTRDDGAKTEYVRPAFASSFNLVDDTYKENLVFSFSHLDSPDGDDKGYQENWEAYNTVNVMEEFKTKFKTDNVFFMGDTNIATGKEASTFKTTEFAKKGYEFGLADIKANATSLSTTETTLKNVSDTTHNSWYSQAYDKVIYNTSIKSDFSDFKSYKVDLYNVL